MKWFSINLIFTGKFLKLLEQLFPEHPLSNTSAMLIQLKQYHNPPTIHCVKYQHFTKLFPPFFQTMNPADTGRKLNVHKTFRRCPGCLLNVLCTLNLRPVSTGKLGEILVFYAVKSYLQLLIVLQTCKCC